MDALAYLINDNDHEQAWPVARDRVIIGRSPVCDVAISDFGLSRQHAVLERRGDQWFVADLGSKNGTQVNGGPIADWTAVSSGDVVTVGKYPLRFSLDRPARSSAPAPPTPSASPTRHGSKSGPPVLLFPGRKRTFSVSDPRPLGYGRSSVLFRGADGEGRPVCVKFFHGVMREHWGYVRAFEDELNAQSSLDHPNVLPVLDYGLATPHQESPFLILPLCEGGNLRQFMEQRRFHPLPIALPILRQVAAALDFAHASGFLHGDIKPENVLFATDRSHVYVSDFGLSRYFNLSDPRTSTAVAAGGGGSTAYLSPEQITYDQQSPRSDIYALAIVAYELVTGHLPFATDQPVFRQMLAKVEGQIVDPHLHNPTIPDSARLALLASLDKDPSRRPRLASEFCRLLEGASAAPAMPAPAAAAERRTVFVSYSHDDGPWLERIRPHLRPLERSGTLEFWDDTRIRPGSDWRAEIRDALSRARIAILLVSPVYLASEFVLSEELPAILDAAQRSGTRIVPVLVEPFPIREHAGPRSIGGPEPSHPNPCGDVLGRAGPAVRATGRRDRAGAPIAAPLRRGALSSPDGPLVDTDVVENRESDAFGIVVGRIGALVEEDGDARDRGHPEDERGGDPSAPAKRTRSHSAVCGAGSWVPPEHPKK